MFAAHINVTCFLLDSNWQRCTTMKMHIDFMHPPQLDNSDTPLCIQNINMGPSLCDHWRVILLQGICFQMQERYCHSIWGKLSSNCFICTLKTTKTHWWSCFSTVLWKICVYIRTFWTQSLTQRNSAPSSLDLTRKRQWPVRIHFWLLTFMWLHLPVTHGICVPVIKL